MNEEINKYRQQLAMMAGSGQFDSDLYHAIEAFILRHDARMAADNDFQGLKAAFNEMATRHNLPTIREQQENFGLNSCAQ